jgi:Bacterial DNA-binding protein
LGIHIFLPPASQTPGCYFEHAMRKTQLARQLARQSGVTKAEAADRLDRVVHQIVSKLRKGRVATLPGLGQFLPAKAPGEKWIFEFEKNDERSGDAGR